MPKLKPNIQEERNRIVRACIAGNKERLAIDDAALAIKVGVTKKTIQNKYHRPETYSLDEMQKIATVLKFTPIQAASVLLDLHAEITGCPFKHRCSYAMAVCHEHRPPAFEIGEGHTAGCFLHHEFSPSVINPITKEEVK